MPLAARKDDACSETGYSAHKILSGASKVTIEGKAAARDGDTISSHTKSPPTHPSSTISGGSSKVTIEGNAAARIGDGTTCGSVISGSCSKVTIN